MSSTVYKAQAKGKRPPSRTKTPTDRPASRTSLGKESKNTVSKTEPANGTSVPKELSEGVGGHLPACEGKTDLTCETYVSFTL